MTNWAEIHTLKVRLVFHENKLHYRKGKLAKWDQAEKTALHWKNKKAYARASAEARRWTALVAPEAKAVHEIEVELNKLVPKKQLWLAGGWVKPGTPFSMQRSDQGQDFEIPRYTAVVAPADGQCTGWGSDRPWSAGFGSPYALVRFDSGPFHNAGPYWYVGHANRPLVHPGEHFKQGQPIAILNNGFTSQWGWTEIGHLPYGNMSTGFKYRSLFYPVWR